jgi:hypothetical protein
MPPETPVDMGMVSAPPVAASPSPPPQADANPRSRGHSPARDAREQRPVDAERKVTVGGTEWDEKVVADAMAERVERQLAREALPKDPGGYEIKLPEGFKPPEGMAFEFKTDDPALKQFREIAHRRGMDQATFSEALGAFASVKVAELAQTNAARDAQLRQLGSAADARIDQVATWLNAKVGDKAKVMIATLKQFPIAANVEALEGIIRAFSAQGGTNFTQSGRDQADEGGRIPGYENLSFVGRRVAQMQSAPAKPGDRR